MALPAILLAAMVALKLTRGRNPKPVFTETYFRDLPSADHPAVISAFMEGGSVVAEAPSEEFFAHPANDRVRAFLRTVGAA